LTKNKNKSEDTIPFTQQMHTITAQRSILIAITEQRSGYTQYIKGE